MSKSVHLGSSAIVKCVKARIAIPHHFSNDFSQNSNLLLINKIIPAVWSGKSKKYPGRSKKWNKSVWSHKQVVSDLPQTVLYVSQRRPCSHWACDGTHTFVVPEILAHHIRLGVIRDWAGHLDLTAKQTCMWAQYIQTSNGHSYTPKWVVTLPEPTPDTSDQTCGGALGLCWSPRYRQVKSVERRLIKRGIHPSTSSCFQLQTYEGTLHVLLARHGLYLDIYALTMLKKGISKSHLFLWLWLRDAASKT